MQLCCMSMFCRGGAVFREVCGRGRTSDRTVRNSGVSWTNWKSWQVCICHVHAQVVGDYSSILFYFFPATMQVENGLTSKRARAECLWRCEQCNYTTRHRGHLNQHASVHSGRRPFKCNLCPMAFSRRAKLANHLQMHIRRNRFQCRFCSSLFTNQSTLGRHVTLMHLTS
ncbi:zinc finger protein 665 [Dermacentor silvarum]|uniref:zinc finger protein 665 n=1 Tax=Dermacentor silvarum TaxID=543639 RepID=UPI001898EC8E|nr:zinc finger protein 665 [Dermacentor silvarum]